VSNEIVLRETRRVIPREHPERTCSTVSPPKRSFALCLPWYDVGSVVLQAAHLTLL